MAKGISRRHVLAALSGSGLGVLLAQYLSDDNSATSVGAPRGGVDRQFGEWPLVITDDWSAVSIDRYPTLVIHVSDGISIFGDGATHRTTLEIGDTSMNVIETADASTVEIDQLPTLLIEAPDNGPGDVTLFQEGDL